MLDIHALVIDDNNRNLSVVSQLLALQGARTTQISHPNQLFDVVPTLEPVDLVLLDLEMPGLDGYQVLNMLRSDSRFDRAPIVACTVHVSEVGVTRDQGFDGFIAKPIDSDRFPEQIERILRGEPVWEAR